MAVTGIASALERARPRRRSASAWWQSGATIATMCLTMGWAYRAVTAGDHAWAVAAVGISWIYGYRTAETRAARERQR